MKLSSETLAVLKNFSGICEAIHIKPGNRITVQSKCKTVYARAEVSDTFPQALAIYNLPQFLNVFGMLNEPDLELSGGREARFISGKTIVRYTFAEPSLIPAAPAGIAVPNVVTTFDLAADELQQLIRGATAMGLPEFVIEGDGVDLRMYAGDTSSPSSNSYNVYVGKTDKSFKAIVRFERFKQMLRDYKVTVSNRLIQFESTDPKGPPTTYWTALEDRSKF